MVPDQFKALVNTTVYVLGAVVGATVVGAVVAAGSVAVGWVGVLLVLTCSPIGYGML